MCILTQQNPAYVGTTAIKTIIKAIIVDAEEPPKNAASQHYMLRAWLSKLPRILSEIFFHIGHTQKGWRAACRHENQTAVPNPSQPVSKFGAGSEAVL